MRILAIGLALLGLAVFFSAGAVVAEEKAKDAKTHEGKVVKVETGKLTMTDKDGKEHSHAITADAKISCDGKECKLEDLKAGQKLKVTMVGDKVTKIEAKKDA